MKNKILLSALLSLCVGFSAAAFFSACDKPQDGSPNASTLPEDTRNDLCDGETNPLIEEVYTNINMADWEKYFLMNDGEITGITEELDRDITTLVIPSVIEGQKIKSISLNSVFLPKLERLILGEGIEKLPDQWRISRNLKEFFIPNSATDGFNQAYLLTNSSLENIFVRGGNPVYKSINGNLYTRDGKTLLMYANKKTDASFVIPNGVTDIMDGVGCGANNLVNVTIPNSVTSVGAMLFDGENIKYNCKDGLCYLGNASNPYLCFLETEDEGITAINIHKDCKLIAGNSIFGESLTQVTIPSGVIYINKNAVNYTSSPNLQFYEEGGLFYLGNAENPYLLLCDWETTDILINPNCKFVHLDRFRNTNITSIRLPDSVTEIPEMAFWNCRYLTEIDLGNGVRYIGDSAFANCYHLQSIYLPASLTHIGEQVFAWWREGFIGQDPSVLEELCKSRLTNIEVDENNSAYKSIDGNLYTKDGKTLLYYAPAKTESSFTIPDGVTKIASGAFDYRMNLISIEIPVSVTEIQAASDAWAFKEIYYQGSIAQWNSISFVGSLVDLNDALVYYNQETISDLTLPEGATAINAYAFYAQSNITSINIPNTVTTIEECAFSQCEGLTEIALPESVREIGAGAFEYCTNLTTINIPNGITKISDGAFRYCTNLTTIVLPQSITEIGESAFEGCENLTQIILPDGVVSIGKSAFNGCKNLSSVNIPNGVKRINEMVFNGCASLTEIVIPEGVISIGKSAFSNCSKLASVNIPQGIVKINDEVFSGCESLTEMVIPKGVVSVGKSAFSNCSKLIQIVLPEGLKYIGDYAFSVCPSLTSISIPDSIQRIARFAFRETTNIQCTEENGLKYYGNEKNPYVCLIGGSVDGVLELRDECEYVWEWGVGISNDVTQFVVSETHKKYKAIDGNLYSKDGKIFIKYAGAKEDEWFILPEGVEEIAANAFSKTDNWKHLLIAKSVLIIHEQKLERVQKNMYIFQGVEYDVGGVLQMRIYIYRETQPENLSTKSKYWHYDENGMPVLWKK